MAKSSISRTTAARKGVGVPSAGKLANKGCAKSMSKAVLMSKEASSVGLDHSKAFWSVVRRASVTSAAWLCLRNPRTCGQRGWDRRSTNSEMHFSYHLPKLEHKQIPRHSDKSYVFLDFGMAAEFRPLPHDLTRSFVTKAHTRASEVFCWYS